MRKRGSRIGERVWIRKIEKRLPKKSFHKIIANLTRKWEREGLG
jgi:hypothetical protein